MKNCRIIIKSVRTDTVKLRKFALDPTLGFLFLAKYDSKSRLGAAILRFSLDGSHVKSLIKEKLFFPIDLSLDIAMKKIYFLDHYFDFIQVCDYDGNNRQFLQKLPHINFRRFSFFENVFYVSEEKNISIVQVLKSSTTLDNISPENLEASPKILKIFHQQIQPPSRFEICSTNNRCKHLCVPTLPEGSSTRLIENCLCKEGFISDNGPGMLISAPDNYKCKLSESRKFVMFVHDYPRMILGVDTDGNEGSLFSPIVDLKPNIAFDVDLNRKFVYFTSFSNNKRRLDNHIIEFRSFDGATRGELKEEFGAIDSIQYDWVGNNLYFTAHTPTSKIAAIKIETDRSKSFMVKTLVYTDIIGPSSLAIDPENGMMFWSSFADTYHIGGKIEMSWMDGTSREVLASKDVNGNGTVFWPVSLTYYRATNTLYWYDVLSQSIEYITLGEKKVRGQNKLSTVHFQSLTVVAGKIFYVNQENNTIDAVRLDSSNFER